MNYHKLFYAIIFFVIYKVTRVIACFSALTYRNLSLLLKLEKKASLNFDILDKNCSKKTNLWTVFIGCLQSAEGYGMLFCFSLQESLSAFEAWTKGLIKLWHPRQKRPGRKWGSPQVENEYLWDSIISVHLRDSVEKKLGLLSYQPSYILLDQISEIILLESTANLCLKGEAIWTQSHCYLLLHAKRML